MQPYFLPYIGYFAMLNAVDHFVFLDDVQYIRRSWVNRNRIRSAQGWRYITLPICKQPRGTLISCTRLHEPAETFPKIRHSLLREYTRAPYWEETAALCEELFAEPMASLSRFNAESTRRIARHLGITTSTSLASELTPTGLKGEERIVEICGQLGADHYINAIGGRSLYDKGRFARAGIRLSFFQVRVLEYSQGREQFVPGLSIVDVLMFNPLAGVREMLQDYELV